MADIEQVKFTEADYLRLIAEEHDGIVEFINGELITYTWDDLPTYTHQIIMGAIYTFLRILLGRDRLMFSPNPVYLTENQYVEPDIFWAGGENYPCVLNTEKGVWHGAPALIVEVISPSSVKRDRIDKFILYEANGVREYWIVDPEGLVLEVYALQDGRYQRVGAYAPGMSFISPLLNHTFDVHALFNS